MFIKIATLLISHQGNTLHQAINQSMNFNSFHLTGSHGRIKFMTKKDVVGRL